MSTEREARYAEAIALSEGVTPGTDQWHDAAARAVMAVADAEQAELRAELAALRGRIEALALNLERGDSIDRGVAAGLHALAVAPAEDTTPAAPHAEDGA